MVGAGDDYTIGDTGGTANTVLVEHSHSGSTGLGGANHTHS